MKDRHSFLGATGERRGGLSSRGRRPVGLEPYASPLDRRRAAHLMRRVGFGGSPSDVAALVGRSPSEVVDEMVSAAVAELPPDPPDWANEPPPGRGASAEERQAYADVSRERLIEFGAEWIDRMRMGSLRERMTLFWHDHFVTQIPVYRLPPYAYRYLSMLREHALGNLKTFVHAVGLDPAMLLYLNGAQNRAGAPNENYARELMELFTMGITGPDGTPNYVDSQDPPGDVQEVARALTGWVIVHASLTSVFRPRRHDPGTKTIFGREGNFDYDDVIEILFEERAWEIAHFISRKIYQEFVYEDADEAVVTEMAMLLVDNDFEIDPLVRTLLKSACFFDGEVIGARIKSPVELTIGLTRETFVDLSQEGYLVVNRLSTFMEQVLLNPPNVAGWPGHQAWISTTTLPVRWITADVFLFGRGQIGGADIRKLADELTDPTWDSESVGAFMLPVAIAKHLLAVPVEHASFANIEEDFAGDLDTFPIPSSVQEAPEYVRNIAKIFLAGGPWYDWDPRADGADTLILSFVRYVTHLPEFQLT